MKRLTEYIKEHLICEHFITLKNKDKDQRHKYAKQVYDMVTKAYEYIGGLAGCKSFKDFKDQYVDDLRNKNLMWKLVRRNGDTITACKIYAINDLGRKSVVMASLDTEQGKNDLNKILSEDYNITDRHAWSEVSGKALGKALNMGAIPLPNHMLYSLLPKKVKNGEIEFIKNENYFYKRLIKGEWYYKMLIGQPTNSKEQIPAPPELIKYIKERGKYYLSLEEKEEN